MKGEETAASQAERHRMNPWLWATLAAVLLLYVFSALRANPTASFGVLQDDGLYFSSAKALASGQGYIFPGFPVAMRATKYPILYPMVLAGVWKLDPHFPENVTLADGLTLAFGCSFLLVAFLILREWPGMGDWPALAVTALCGLSSEFLYLSACVMSEVPFCAVALASVWLAVRGLRRADRGETAVLGAGLLAGLSVGFKSLGVCVVGGIWLSLLIHRRYRSMGRFCLSALPLTGLFLWPAFSALLHRTHGLADRGISGSGWTQTLCYYSSYACSWRMGITSFASLEAVVKSNMVRVALSPGVYLLAPLARQGGHWGLILAVLVSAAAWAGIVRYMRAIQWAPFPLIFVLFLLIVLPWPYTPERFLLVFLPFFFGGLWLEGKRLTSLSWKFLRHGGTASERASAGILMALLYAVGAAIVVNYSYSIPTSQHRLGSLHARVLSEERGAFAWIQSHAAPAARVVAYEDGLAYLYTDHPSIQPLATLPQSYFLHEARFAREDAAHLAAVATHIGASYWLTTPYDSNAEDPGNFGIVQERQRELLSKAPVVYRGAGGYVELYAIGDLRRHIRQPRRISVSSKTRGAARRP